MVITTTDAIIKIMIEIVSIVGITNTNVIPASKFKPNEKPSTFFLKRDEIDKHYPPR